MRRFRPTAFLLTASIVVATLVPQASRVVDASTGAGLRIVDAAGNTPVVNEGGRIALRVVDGSGSSVTASSWTIDNKSIGKVKRSNGLLRGKAFGFATVTVETAQGAVSGFVVCARVRQQTGAMTQGDTKTDAAGNVYLSSPTKHVLYKATAVSADVFAGQSGVSGFEDGTGSEVRFNGPAGIGVDNRNDGGLYVADTANHCIRKISFRGRSSLAVGTPGLAGTMHGDENPMAETVLSGPRGVASVGSCMFVTDTGNHCVWYVDVQKQRVQLVAGEPGEAGQANGEGRAARFNSPSGITVNTRGNLLAVADTGNNVVRLIAIVPRGDGDGVVGQVTTLGLGSSTRNARILEKLGEDRGTDEIAFDAPVSVSFDGVDNVYVIDNQTASVVTRPSVTSGRPVQRVNLAQVGTLGDPASVAVRRTQTFVLNEAATSEASAVNVVQVGAPTIAGISDDTDRLEGGKVVTISGTNFAPESRLTLGDAEVASYEVRSSREIVFTVPAQRSPGALTLTVTTRGGTDQTRFYLQARSLAEISAREITTVAGGVRYTGDGGLASEAALSAPTGVQLDGRGGLFVADTTFSRVRRVDRDTGLVTIFAGSGARGDSGDGSLATAARLSSPHSVVLDPGGNLYISDVNAARIRRVDAVTGRISSVVGTGEAGSDGNGGPATAARISAPQGLAFDRRGNLFFADGRANVVRRVDAATGIVTNVAGTGVAGDSGDGGPARLARLSQPESLAFDSNLNLYVAERGSRKIRRIDGQTLVISTFAGTGAVGSSGDGGPAVNAQLDPSGLVFDEDDNLYVSDTAGPVIRRIDAVTRFITTIAGTGEPGFDGDGGPATMARLFIPRGLTLGATRELYFSDSGNHRIRSIDLDSGIISTLFGVSIPMDSGDGSPAIRAHLAACNGLVLDEAGDVLIAESGLDRIRRLRTADGTIETIAGTGETGYSGDGGPAVAARLNAPKGLAIDPEGRVVVSDTLNHCLRRIENGNIETIAGTGTGGYSGDGGPSRQASLNLPGGVVIDDAGTIYFADTGNNCIRRIDSGGTITTIAGTGVGGFGGDGGPALAARLAAPFGLAFDRTGGLLVADQLNNCIRRVDLASGIITRIAGTTITGFSGDGGPALTAKLKQPDFIGVDGVGNILVADTQNLRIRRIDAMSGRIGTLAGTGDFGYVGDGGPCGEAELAEPEGVLVDRAGNVYFADALNGAIRVIKQAAAPTS